MRVYDYAPGKVDWLAHGLPVEGTGADGRTAGALARQDVVTCSIEDAASEALRRIDPSPYGFALVLSPGGVLLGRVRRSALKGAQERDSIEALLEPGPSTIRPHLTFEELRDRLQGTDVHTLVVTTPAGVLLGVVRRDDVPT